MASKNAASASVLLQSAVLLLFLQNLVILVSSEVGFEDQKNFFVFPNPNARPPPSVLLYPPPAHSSGVHHAPPVPSDGGTTPPADCVRPPGGGHRNPTPSSPGSRHGHSPPSSTPSTPAIASPPTTATPSPRFPLDPNTPPFTCTYWRNHPTLIWGLLGWWGTVGTAALPGPQINLLHALSNTRSDSIGKLYREGTAALLNSMAHATQFPYTTAHVRDSFAAALSSNEAASAQAQLFRLANEGRIKIKG